MNTIFFLTAGIWPFSKSTDILTTKIIFHASSLGIPERQQLGKATLSPQGFRLALDGKDSLAPVTIDVPLNRMNNLRTFQKKTYSSTFYVVQVDYKDYTGKSCMVSFEIRVFLRRGQALVALKTWKDLYKVLKG